MTKTNTIMMLSFYGNITVSVSVENAVGSKTKKKDKAAIFLLLRSLLSEAATIEVILNIQVLKNLFYLTCLHISI